MYQITVWSVSGKGTAVAATTTSFETKRACHEELLFKYGYHLTAPLTGLKVRLISKIGKTYNISTS